MKNSSFDLTPAEIQNQSASSRRPAAFTFVELLVIVAVLAVSGSILIPALARSQPTSKTFQCQNNLRQLYSGWRQWADDNNLSVLYADPQYSSPPPWMGGSLDLNGSNPSNFDTNQDIARSPLWSYVGKNPAVFKCPADPSTVVLGFAWNGLAPGTVVPRVRSVSMNLAFGQGGWLNGTPGGGQPVWRVYRKINDIVVPAQTFVFADEHAGSINDGVLNVQCTGANSPSTARIIDIPASYHNGAANFSFADGHALCHQWIGQTIRPAFVQGYYPPLNVPAGDSWVDVQWLAQNTTVRR